MRAKVTGPASRPVGPLAQRDQLHDRQFSAVADRNPLGGLNLKPKLEK